MRRGEDTETKNNPSSLLRVVTCSAATSNELTDNFLEPSDILWTLDVFARVNNFQTHFTNAAVFFISSDCQNHSVGSTRLTSSDLVGFNLTLTERIN